MTIIVISPLLYHSMQRLTQKKTKQQNTHTHKAALTVQKTARRILLYGFRGAAQEHPPDFSPARPPEQSGTRNHLAFTESTV